MKPTLLVVALAVMAGCGGESSGDDPVQQDTELVEKGRILYAD